jgi:hypothetical protein
VGDVLVGLERGHELACPLPEELGGIRVLERRHLVFLLAGYPQRSAARHEHVQVRARAEQARKLRGGADDLFEVVEEQQQPLFVDEPGEIVLGTDRRRDRRHDHLVVAQRCERDPASSCSSRSSPRCR